MYLEYTFTNNSFDLYSLAKKPTKRSWKPFNFNLFLYFFVFKSEVWAKRAVAHKTVTSVVAFFNI